MDSTAIPFLSRASVKKKIDEFLNYALKEASSPAVRAIVGEWGEGKTEAYERYVRAAAGERKFKTCRVLASTLDKCLEGSKYSTLIQSSPVSAVRFLGALFLAAREEDALADLPDPELVTNASEFVTSSLDAVCSEGSRLVVFIDEFEELILSPRVNDIISGIKEIINPPASLGPNSRLVSSRVHLGGKDEGGLHLIIACTPDAFYRLQTHEDYNLVFGSLGRRWGVIDLQPLSKEEGIAFLQHLLAYCYRGVLPSPHPFESSGIFEALLRVSQRNPGVMVSLMTRLLNSATQKDEFHVVDAEFLIGFLRNESISISGQTPCLESGTFDRIVRLVGDQKSADSGLISQRLLRLLIGEARPFTLEELEVRMNAPARSVKDAVNIVNARLKTEGIPQSIIRMSPLRDGRTVDDVQNLFEPYTAEQEGTKFVRVNNFAEPLTSLLSRIQYTLEPTTDQLVLMLPGDAESAAASFDGIGDEVAQELANACSRRLCTESRSYLISDAVLDQVYPIPVPNGLEFITDRNRRFKQWRETTRELSSRFNEQMPSAFVSLIEYVGQIGVTIGRQETRRIWVDLESGSLGVIRSAFIAVNGDVTADTVEEISRTLRSSSPLHLVVFLFTGEITQQAADKLTDKQLTEADNPRLLWLKLHPTLVKKLLITAEATRSIKRDEDREELSRAASTLLDKEIEFNKKLESWERQQESAGRVIADPVTGDSFRDFVDSIKYFVNYPGEERTTDERFVLNNNELLKFVLFNSRLGLVPDIETVERLKEIVQDLIAAGFLVQKGKYVTLKSSPIEGEILRVLNAQKKVTAIELESNFIIRAKGKNLLARIYLPILEYKGLIEVKGDHVSLVDQSTLVKVALGKLADYEGAVKNLAKSGYAHIFQVKERGERLILLASFDTWVRDKLKRAQATSSVTSALEANLLIKLLHYFRTDVVPIYVAAKQHGDSLVGEIRQLARDGRSSLEGIAAECARWFSFAIDPKDITELVEIEEIVKRAEALHEASTSEDQLQSWIREMEATDRSTFQFTKSSEDPPFFNLKVWKLQLDLQSAMQLKQVVDHHVENLNQRFSTLATDNQDVAKRVRTYSVLPLLHLSTECGKILKSPELLRGDAARKGAVRTSLSEISRIVKELSEGASRRIRDLKNAQASLEDELVPAERGLVETLEESEKFKQYLSRFDIPGYVEASSEFTRTIAAVQTGYQDLQSTVKFAPVGETPRVISLLRKSLNEFASSVSAAMAQVDFRWHEYRDSVTEFISHADGIIGAVVKREGQLNRSDIDRLKEELARLVEKGSIRVLQSNLSQIDHLKDDIRNKLYKAVAPFLDEPETRALEVVIAKLERSKEGWIPFSEVHQAVKKSASLTPEQTNEVLQRLIKKRYLRGGVALIG